MLILYAWPWHWSGSALSALTLLVLVVAAIIAWRQVREAQSLREDQARPFVLIDFEPVSTIVEITITNIGKTLARDVHFKFDRSLESTHDRPGDVRGPVKDLNVFKTGIPSLAPGKEIRVFFDQFPSRVEAKLPMTYEVEVTYRNPAGKDFREQMVLDLMMYYGTGGITRHGLHDLHKQLKEIADNMKRWTDFAGLKVLTYKDMKERQKEWDVRLEEQEREEQPPPQPADEDQPPSEPEPNGDS